MLRTRGEKIFQSINYVFLVLFTLMMIFPVIYVLKMSLDIGGQGEIELSLIPKEFSWLYYKSVFTKSGIYTSFLVSLYVMVVGTLISIACESLGAYALSRRTLPGNRAFTYMLILPMIFSGGLVPSYLVVKYLGLMDSYWAMILPACISGWNIILIRNYYWTIPESLRESARIDGAGEFTQLFRIILPLSKPVLAAITLFTAVGFWNTFMSAVLYISSIEKYPFQLVLRELISSQQNIENEMMNMGLDVQNLKNVNSESLAAAMIIISMIPVVIVYPYLQKHFVKGIMVGSVKG